MSSPKVLRVFNCQQEMSSGKVLETEHLAWNFQERNHRICSMLDVTWMTCAISRVQWNWDNWADVSLFLEGQEQRSCTFLAKPVWFWVIWKPGWRLMDLCWKGLMLFSSFTLAFLSTRLEILRHLKQRAGLFCPKLWYSYVSQASTFWKLMDLFDGKKCLESIDGIPSPAIFPPQKKIHQFSGDGFLSFSKKP